MNNSFGRRVVLKWWRFTVVVCSNPNDNTIATQCSVGREVYDDIKGTRFEINHKSSIKI